MNAALALPRRAGRHNALWALIARGGRDMDLEQWAVEADAASAGSSSLLLLAGENLHHLSPFWARPAFPMGSRGSGLLHPGLRLARVRDRLFHTAAPGLELRQGQHGLHSAAGFLRSQICEPVAGRAGLGVDLVALIPYLVLQLTGLGIIVTAAGYGAPSQEDAAIWIRPPRSSRSMS